MATITANSQLTLSELANRMDPKGNLSTIAEVLSEDNEMLVNALFLEANDTFSHKITRRAALPSGSWRKLNEGVATESTQTINVTEGIGMLETFSQADKDLVMAAPNSNQFRMDEASGFLEGLSQTLADTFIYGNSTTTPESFTGLAPRMDALAATTNVIGAGGSSTLTSIYLVQWGPRNAHMIYPKGSNAGLFHEDLGLDTVEDASGNKFRAYVDHFQVKTGFALQDGRSIARLANIETDSPGAADNFDEDDLITLVNRFPMRGKGIVLYVNASILTAMQIALKDKANVNYTADGGDGLSGAPLVRFQGYPIRKMDSITNAESTLT